MTCRHNHPYPDACTECVKEAAAWNARKDERAQIVKLVNLHFAKHSKNAGGDLIAALRDDIVRMP